jgi:hypothetical protein
MKSDVRGHLDLVLLGVLASAPGHGYAVINELKERTDGVLELPEGSVPRPASAGGPGVDRQRVEAGTRVTAAGISPHPSGHQAAGVGTRDWTRVASAIEAVLASGPDRRNHAVHCRQPHDYEPQPN